MADGVIPLQIYININTIFMGKLKRFKLNLTISKLWVSTNIIAVLYSSSLCTIIQQTKAIVNHMDCLNMLELSDYLKSYVPVDVCHLFINIFKNKENQDYFLTKKELLLFAAYFNLRIYRSLKFSSKTRVICSIFSSFASLK